MTGSLASVKNQYETYPYPAWTQVDLVKVEASLRDRLAKWGVPLGGSLLDVGCGTGLHLAACASLGFEVVGLDFSEVSLRLASRRFKELGLRGSFFSGDLFSLPFKKKFDLVTSLGVLHHTELPLEGLRAISSLVRRKGYLLVFFYNPHSLRHKFVDAIIRRRSNSVEGRLRLVIRHRKLLTTGLLLTHPLVLATRGPRDLFLSPLGPVENTVDAFAHQHITYVSMGKVKETLAECGFSFCSLFYGPELPQAMGELFLSLTNSFFILAQRIREPGQ